MGNRTRKSILNAEVNIIFYLLGTFVAFFSRKIFLDCLGADFIGLTGTLMSILSLLNLSELGIGLSVSYFLYKPLADNNQQKISDILSLLGYLYKRIGQFILASGIIISIFFPLIFINNSMPLSIVYFAFYSFLCSSAIGYFINYRQTLLDADQKMYLVSIYSQSFSLLKSIIQILLAIYYKNLYIWVAIEFVSSLVQCWVLNWKINKEYPWIKTNKSRGPALLKEYPDVLKKTKQIVIHQLKDFLLTKSDEIMIFAFVSLKIVAYYGNYVMIITKLSTMFLTFFSGMAAGIGNLIAESNKTHINNIFWQLSSMKYISAGILVITLSFLINPFISWWLGSEYELSAVIVILFMINLFFMQTRSIVDMFNHSYGLYGDVWAAWAEGIINITVTIAIAFKWGIIGILMGKIVSLFLIVVIWKPYYLYSKGFKESVWGYWKGVISYYFCFALAFAYLILTMHLFKNAPEPTLKSMIFFGLTEVIPSIIIYLLTLIVIGRGTKELLKRIPLLSR
jgi:O-antigen/teichoic acid export membrane protein